MEESTERRRAVSATEDRCDDRKDRKEAEEKREIPHSPRKRCMNKSCATATPRGLVCRWIGGGWWVRPGVAVRESKIQIPKTYLKNRSSHFAPTGPQVNLLRLRMIDSLRYLPLTYLTFYRSIYSEGTVRSIRYQVIAHEGEKCWGLK